MHRRSPFVKGRGEGRVELRARNGDRLPEVSPPPCGLSADSPYTFNYEKGAWRRTSSRIVPTSVRFLKRHFER